MSYLQRVVEQALLKNPNCREDAKDYAKSINKFSDLLNFDPENRALIADQLGASHEQMSGFLTIVKAIYNGGKCEEKVNVRTDYYDQICESDAHSCESNLVSVNDEFGTMACKICGQNFDRNEE